ncbi:hypothetical protein D4T97_011590 [Siminovitchia acidinfaciens]|uniref:TcaA protein NTF2-like domain-containing protein n=1 Tax=Siminovitchia acidinfaciens TaxID=2321395 RepID=A0A429XZU2_9BACI|nr:hypothetical protein [Siminovitchia acidinfaciens]RST74306.1 hypothetical protein D4T97_011590 [Siminovitchia acidinfaciens]
MNSQRFMALLLVLGIFLLAGCNKNQAQGQKKPNKIHNDFLLFEEKYTGESDQSIGDLYLISHGKEKEKIASKVKDGFYYYINSQEKVLFINEENELFESVKGKEKSKLAKDVIAVNGNYDKDIVTFQNPEGDLYVIIGENEKDKIASRVTHYKLIGSHIYYLNEGGNFLMYNIEDKQETEIASDVFSFTSLSDKEEVAYLNEDYALYYKSADDQQSIKITGNEVSPEYIIKVGSNLVYYNIEDGSQDIYVSSISEGGTSKKLASDIRDFQYEDGYYYYVNNDDNLYKKKENDENSTKLASDVLDFKVKNGKVFFTDKDENLFQLKDETPEKVASSVMYYEVTSKGDVIYKTDDEDLFLNNEKVASGVNLFSHYFGNLAFSSDDDKLYFMENMGDKKVIVDDLNQFSNAYYQNTMIFSNELAFEDIAGVWKADVDEGIIYLEVNKKGTFTFLQTGDSEQLKKSYATYSSLNAMLDDTDITFSLAEDRGLTMTMNGISETLTKTTKEEAAEHYKNVAVAKDKEEVSYVMDQYLTNYEYGVNYGDGYYIKDYLNPGSPIYEEQLNYVESTYKRDIRVELEDYTIDSIISSGDGVYSVTCTEVFTIYGSDDTDNTGKTKKFKNTYTLKYIDGFLITDIKVSSLDTL